MRRLLPLLLSLCVLPLACTNDDGEGSSSELDVRCSSLCVSDSDACTAEVEACEQVCQARVESVSPACATCLVEGASFASVGVGSFTLGEDPDPTPSCEDHDFPWSPLDCTELCAEDVGVNPSGTHPVCADICADEDPECGDDVQSCLQSCNARVTGVDGLCATCLLQGASASCAVFGGDPDASCCSPDPEYTHSITDCALYCG